MSWMSPDGHCERSAAIQGVMDCHVAVLSMNRHVIANAVKQSMSLDCMDCRALACPELSLS